MLHIEEQRITADYSPEIWFSLLTDFASQRMMNQVWKGKSADPDLCTLKIPMNSESEQDIFLKIKTEKIHYHRIAEQQEMIQEVLYMEEK